MPTLNGVMPRNVGDVPDAACVWCRKPTDLRFIPEGLPHLGLQPLHLFCGMALIRAYQRWLAGHVLSPGDADRLRQIAAPHSTLGPPGTSA